MRKLYTFLFYFLVFSLGLLALPLLALWPKARKGFGMRLGVLPREVRDLALVGQGSLWVHAASLGEVNAIAPVVRLLAAKLKDVPLLFTHTTMAGLEQSRKLFPEGSAHLLLPLDLPLFLKPLFRRFRPAFAVITETELWPNLMAMLKASGCQTLLANGRMTEKSLAAYMRFRPLFADALLNYDSLAMQSREDASRLIALGAKASRVLVTGNTKFDVSEQAAQARRRVQGLREELGLSEGAPLIVAGSTRPGEEPLLLAAFAQLRAEIPGLRLLLAPRHLERMDEVAEEVKAAGFGLSRRSHGKAQAEVILLDTLGELFAAYGLASLAWVGGSFRPFGGQNPIEPVSLGVPVLFGPDMSHFRDAARLLLESGAAMQVAPEELAPTSLGLLRDKEGRARMARAGQECVAQAAGASQRTADLAWKMAVMARMKEKEHDWRERSAYSSQKATEFGSTVEPPR